MKKLTLACFMFSLCASFLTAQEQVDEFDTIFKYPDRKGEKHKVIRGEVVEESTKEVRYQIGGSQEKSIDAQMVYKILYGTSGDNKADAIRETFNKGFLEYEKGNYEEAVVIFEKTLNDLMNYPRAPKWIGAYSRFYLGKSALELGLRMEKEGMAEVLVKRKFKGAVDAFKTFKEKHPGHRLQLELPIPYAEALVKTGPDNYDAALALLDEVNVDSRNQYVQLRKFKAMKLKGDILKLKKQLSDAIAVYEDIVRTMPSDAIDELMKIRQEVGIYIGTVYIEEGKFRQAEDYFRKILQDVTKSGISAGDIGKVYLNLGTCVAKDKRWAEAQWYFLHGCTAFFDDSEVHRESLKNVIICLDNMIQNAKDEKKKTEYTDALKEYYRQLTNYYGSTKARAEAQKIYQKYK